MDTTLYRRPLPTDTIAFSSSEGRSVFAEALASGGLDGYFPLAEQFHTQSDPAFCGLGSLVVALNALGIDPGRLWKGPWRWFAEDMLDCCVPLSEVRERGVDLDELACLARCNGALVDLHRADADTLDVWRAGLVVAARGEAVVVASYDRASLAQTGSGHFSPIGGYHRERDLVLVLDVARFKYPPHWVSAERLFEAMRPVDPSTGRSRGWMTLTPRARGIALGFSLRCEGESWQQLAQRLSTVIGNVQGTEDLSTLARAVEPLVAHVELRATPVGANHDAVAAAREALRAVPAYRVVGEVVGPTQVEAVTVLLLAMADFVVPARRAALQASLDQANGNADLAAELRNMSAQLGALMQVQR